MQFINLNDRHCATCRWWAGTREIKFQNGRPFKLQTDGTGRCLAKKIDRNAQGICSNYVRWEHLP